MKVILLQDVKKQGKKDDIINVSDGYANNFLIKNGLAVPVTEGSKKILNAELEARKKEEDAFVKYRPFLDNFLLRNGRYFTKERIYFSSKNR